ncbi:helix-turn-helix transcriptional regulator [uncultured Phycicoccus sp.]|uniref:helix-turn-helix transcriptional regulator n=1 Tax=uncultured Phycicoccus sp. TaxID=661422 RepID=UPI00260E4DD4|nr:helix-turn-helix transcriptional regulator [uncultured Phycicoccus sp.]
MGSGDLTVEAVTGLLAAMAATHDPACRRAAMLDALTGLADARVGLLLRGGPASAAEACWVPAALLADATRGDLTPRSAERTWGRRVWRGSPERAAALEAHGVDQVCTVPLRGGLDVTAVALGRAGADFTEPVLRRLTTLQPCLAGLAALAGLLPPPGRGPSLTRREHEVLALLAAGHTTQRIGRELGSSPRTVEVHLRRIYTKLGVADRLGAVLHALDLGLVAPRPPAQTGSASVSSGRGAT